MALAAFSVPHTELSLLFVVLPLSKVLLFQVTRSCPSHFLSPKGLSLPKSRGDTSYLSLGCHSGSYKKNILQLTVQGLITKIILCSKVLQMGT